MDMTAITKVLTTYEAAARAEVSAQANVTKAEEGITAAKIVLNSASDALTKAQTATAAAWVKVEEAIAAEISAGIKKVATIKSR